MNKKIGIILSIFGVALLFYVLYSWFIFPSRFKAGTSTGPIAITFIEFSNQPITYIGLITAIIGLLIHLKLNNSYIDEILVPLKLFSLLIGIPSLVAIFFLIILPSTISNPNIDTLSIPSTDNAPSNSPISCNPSEAKSFAVNRINTTIGKTQFLDLHRDLENKWLFYGSAYSSRYNRDVTVWVLINCSNGSYDVENVEVDI